MKTLREQVAEFHEVGGHYSQSTPKLPPKEVIVLRAKLIVEECFEALEALFPDCQGFCKRKEEVLDTLGLLAVWESSTKPDIVAFADACGDIDYVVEGARQAFGIDGKPIADAIHAANMAKFPGGKVLKREDGKVIKPEGWKPPDIEAELIKQGWVKVA